MEQTFYTSLFSRNW